MSSEDAIKDCAALALSEVRALQGGPLLPTMARDHRAGGKKWPCLPWLRSAGRSAWDYCRRASCVGSILVLAFSAQAQAQVQAQDFGPLVTTAQQTLADLLIAYKQTQVLLDTAQKQSAADTATILALRTQVATLQAQLAGVPACPPVVICPVCPPPVICPAPLPPPVVTPPPPAPAGTVNLAWDPVSVATSYRVYFGTASGVYLQGPGQGIQTTLTTMTVGGLSSVRYFFVVTSVNAQGESGFSNEVFKDVGAVAPPVVTPPPVVIPPPPPPPTGASADCTKMPPAGQIVAGDAAVWALLPAIGGLAGQVGVARSGVRVSQAVDFVTIKGGAICQRDEGLWECWAGSWVPGAAPAGC